MTNDPLLDSIIEIARIASGEILKIYETDFQIDEKSDSSPLTEADLASNRSIVQGLETLEPRLPILSEESSEIPFEEREKWARYWLVDPLDGTKEFIKKNGEFTVNIALIENHKPVLGVVYVPVSGVCYAASPMAGALKIHQQQVEAIRVNPAPTSPYRVVGSRSHPSPDLAEYLTFVGEHTMVPMGSSLKFCLVAEGSADVYPRHGLTSEWDTAAAQAVVEAAGGFVLDWDGDPIIYNTKESYLNPHFLVCGPQLEHWLPTK